MIRLLRRYSTGKNFIYTLPLIEKTENEIKRVISEYTKNVACDLNRISHIDKYQKYYGKIDIKINLNQMLDRTSMTGKYYQWGGYINIRKHKWAIYLAQRDLQVRLKKFYSFKYRQPDDRAFESHLEDKLDEIENILKKENSKKII